MELGLNSGDFQAEKRKYWEDRRAFQVLEYHEQGMGSVQGIADRVGRPVWLKHEVRCEEGRRMKLGRGRARPGGLQCNKRS